MRNILTLIAIAFPTLLFGKVAHSFIRPDLNRGSYRIPTQLILHGKRDTTPSPSVSLRKINKQLDARLNEWNKEIEFKRRFACGASPMLCNRYIKLKEKNDSMLLLISRVSEVFLYTSSEILKPDTIQNFVNCVEAFYRAASPKGHSPNVDQVINEYFDQIYNFYTYSNTLEINDIEVEVKVIDSLTRNELPDFQVVSKSKYTSRSDVFNPTIHAKKKIRPGQKIFTIKKGAIVKQQEHEIDSNDKNTWIVYFTVNPG